MFVVGVSCKSCPDSFSPSLSVSLIITGGDSAWLNKANKRLTKQIFPPCSYRSWYLKLPKPDREIQHRWLHWRSHLQHHRRHQRGPAQLYLRPAHLHHPLRLHLHCAFHQPVTGTGTQWAAGRRSLDHPARALWSSVRAAGPQQW